jgi:hypothetical protein
MMQVSSRRRALRHVIIGTSLDCSSPRLSPTWPSALLRRSGALRLVPLEFCGRRLSKRYQSVLPGTDGTGSRYAALRQRAGQTTPVYKKRVLFLLPRSIAPRAVILCERVNRSYFPLAVELCIPGTLTLLELALDSCPGRCESAYPNIDVFHRIMGRRKNCKVCAFLNLFRVCQADITVRRDQKPFSAIAEANNPWVLNPLLLACSVSCSRKMAYE